MAMAELKTKRTGASVDAFLNSIADEQMRADCWTLVDIMQQAANAKPEMWGADLVGFGTYHYKYPSGREAEWMMTSFAPRKKHITLYIMPGFEDRDQLMSRLGRYVDGGKSCIHIKRVADVHLPTLKKLVRASVKFLKHTFPASR